MRVAQENGWEILREERQISESDSVDAASRICEDRGVTALLRVPLDVPLGQSSDIDELLPALCAGAEPVSASAVAAGGRNAASVHPRACARRPRSRDRPRRTS